MMRNIDYYIGIPLCFLLTWVMKIVSVLFPPVGGKPRNILFMELSEMGSAILADPAMRKARTVFGASLYFCIFSGNRESLLLLNTVDEDHIFSIREDSFVTLMVDTLKFIFWIRKKKIDAVIDLELFARFTALLTGLSGAANRVGFFAYHNEGLYRGGMLTHRVAYNPHIHISRNFISLVNALISDNREVPYSKTVISDSEVELARVAPSDGENNEMWKRVKSEYAPLKRRSDHLVLVNPNASDLLPQRRWPREHFVALIRMILEYDDTAVVLITGSRSEYEEAQEITEMTGMKRCINFCGKVEFQELPALYSISTLMVTNDSGPAHFSAVTELRTFVLFGPETPLLYGSLGNSTPIYAGLACSPCVSAANHRKTPCRDNICLQVILPSYVFKKVRPCLKKNIVTA